MCAYIWDLKKIILLKGLVKATKFALVDLFTCADRPPGGLSKNPAQTRPMQPFYLGAENTGLASECMLNQDLKSLFRFSQYAIWNRRVSLWRLCCIALTYDSMFRRPWQRITQGKAHTSTRVSWLWEQSSPSFLTGMQSMSLIETPNWLDFCKAVWQVLGPEFRW